MSFIMTFCQMQEIKTSNCNQQNNSVMKNCESTKNEQKQELKHLIPSNFGDGGQHQIHLSSMSINQNLEFNTLNITNQNNNIKKLRPENLRFPSLTNPVITITDGNMITEICPSQQQKAKTPASPSSIIPPPLLPNILVQPLIQKWSPVELKVLFSLFRKKFY